MGVAYVPVRVFADHLQDPSHEMGKDLGRA